MLNKKIADRWESDAFKNKEIAKKIANDVKTKLKILPHSFSGWRSEPNQNLDTIKINENGLRSKSLSNLRFKDNAFLIGGSLAWGFGASSNEFTPAYLIENFLCEKYNIKLNFINLADQMFTSYEELISFINNVELLKPKLVVFLSGCNDINSEINESYKVNELYKKVFNFSLWGINHGIFNEKNNLKIIIKFLLRKFKTFSKVSEDYYLLRKPEKNKIANTLIKEKFEFVNSYCLEKKIKCFHFLQPDLNFKKDKSESERKYLQSHFTTKKTEFLIEKYKYLEKKFYNFKSNDIFCYSLLRIFDEDRSSLFFDRVHLTDKGYLKISKEVSKKIAENFLNSYSA